MVLLLENNHTLQILRYNSLFFIFFLQISATLRNIKSPTNFCSKNCSIFKNNIWSMLGIAWIIDFSCFSWKKKKIRLFENYCVPLKNLFKFTKAFFLKKKNYFLCIQTFLDYDYFSTVSFSPQTCYVQITPKSPHLPIKKTPQVSQQLPPSYNLLWKGWLFLFKINYLKYHSSENLPKTNSFDYNWL